MELRWCADRGLDPLAARRPDLEQYIRWMQEIRRFKPSTVSRRDSAMPRGTLRIYLGAAPGVGKTYAMLGEAHRRESRGESVVVSVPNRNAVLESFEARKAIQKEAFR